VSAPRICIIHHSVQLCIQGQWLFQFVIWHKIQNVSRLGFTQTSNSLFLMRYSQSSSYYNNILVSLAISVIENNHIHFSVYRDDEHEYFQRVWNKISSNWIIHFHGIILTNMSGSKMFFDQKHYAKHNLILITITLKHSRHYIKYFKWYEIITSLTLFFLFITANQGACILKWIINETQ